MDCPVKGHRLPATMLAARIDDENRNLHSANNSVQIQASRDICAIDALFPFLLLFAGAGSFRASQQEIDAAFGVGMRVSGEMQVGDTTEVQARRQFVLEKTLRVLQRFESLL